MATIILRLDRQGPDVKALQAALLAHGFKRSQMDGQFQGGTQAALFAFQTSQGHSRFNTSPVG
jgi:peptidoglycan hydrolase-like protein with peptidoglycan-binding domain